MPNGAQLMVGVLGPVAVLHDDAPRTPASPVIRALLGALAIAAPGALQPDSLVRTVWGHSVPRDARATLQLAVHRLRQWLKESGDGLAVRTGLDGYRLDLGAATSDLLRFRSLTMCPGNRYETLARALHLWRGSPLANVPAGRTDPDVVAGLREEHATAVRRCAAAALAEGAAESAIALLRPLCAANPLDEEAHALLIGALTATGQRAAALGELDRIRRRLAADLGMQPGAQLRSAYTRLIEPTRTAPQRTWHGPRPLVPLIGRDTDRAALAELLRHHRIVSICGPGGVGKTVLALDVARIYQGGGVFVVPLGDARSSDAAASRIRTVGRALLVLDGCEHLLPDFTASVAQLVAGARELTVLSTSRQPLGISGEVVWRLDPLPTSADGGAVELFVRRASEAVPGFSATGADLARVVRICRRVDGLPLALELAAAELRTLSLAALDERLARNLSVLGEDGRPDSLPAVVDRSYRRLDAPARRLLARLSAFRDGFTIDEAEAVCAGVAGLPADILPPLTTLVEHSLVQPYDTRLGRRYRILAVVREHATRRARTPRRRPRPGWVSARRW
jgi:DNA-binding SARP family transcriptional activator